MKTTILRFHIILLSQLVTNILESAITMKYTIPSLAINLLLSTYLVSTASAGEATINQQAVQDAIEINQANLWAKPSNPIAAGSENNAALKVVQNFFVAYGKGDMDTLKNYVAEDVEWHIPGRHKLAGTKRGIDEFITFFNQLGTAGFKAKVMILAANDNYVIDAHRGWSTQAEQNIDLNWVLLYQIENGKIKRVQNFSGDWYASDQFFNQLFQD